MLAAEPSPVLADKRHRLTGLGAGALQFLSFVTAACPGCTRFGFLSKIPVTVLAAHVACTRVLGLASAETHERTLRPCHPSLSGSRHERAPGDSGQATRSYSPSVGTGLSVASGKGFSRHARSRHACIRVTHDLIRRKRRSYHFWFFRIRLPTSAIQPFYR